MSVKLKDNLKPESQKAYKTSIWLIIPDYRMQEEWECLMNSNGETFFILDEKP